MNETLGCVPKETFDSFYNMKSKFQYVIPHWYGNSFLIFSHLKILMKINQIFTPCFIFCHSIITPKVSLMYLKILLIVLQNSIHKVTHCRCIRYSRHLHHLYYTIRTHRWGTVDRKWGRNWLAILHVEAPQDFQ